MARIVVLTHEYDDFEKRRFLLSTLFPRWRQRGHSIAIAAGCDRLPDGDLAILHVDRTVMPEDYLAAAARYPSVINRLVRDIRKRVVSRNLIARDDPWRGPVIVKTDLNYGGVPEHLGMRAARRAGRPAPSVGTVMRPDYPIHDSIDAVPPSVWSDPVLVVEKFLPERDQRGYWIRTWSFFGDRERCNRSLAATPIVKAGNLIHREPAPVPEEIRAERARLGFDFGKFDFVVHEGRPILLDANRTPAGPPPGPATDERSAANLADGIDGFLR